jgi:hypothetical protein
MRSNGRYESLARHKMRRPDGEVAMSYISHVGAGLLVYAVAACGSRTGLFADPPQADASDTPDGPLPQQQISAGATQSCLVFNGTLRCWGDNGAGQLGDGTTTQRNRPVAISLPPVAEVSALDVSTCARLVSGEVECWGANGAGVVGDGQTDAASPVTIPTATLGVSNAVSLAHGPGLHECATLASGIVVCWGENSEDEFSSIGDGRLVEPTPVPVGALAGAFGVWVGDFYTCGVLQGGALACVGSNTSGQLGDGTDQSRDNYTPVVGIEAPSYVAVSNLHSCAVLHDGSLRCWGQNIGVASGVDYSPLPAQVDLPSPTAVEVGCGFFHTCALLRDGAVYCWGANDKGQVGDGTLTNRSTPTRVPGLAFVLQIAVGNSHTCALMAGGKVKCWG